MTTVPVRERQREIWDPETQGRSQREDGGREIGVMLPQAKELLEPP